MQTKIVLFLIAILSIISCNKEVKESKAPSEKITINKLEIAQDFMAEDVNGKSFSWKDYKNKPILLDVWASWCGPCIKQIPSTKELNERYKDKLHIIAVSLDENKNYWLNAITNYDLDQNQYLINQEGVSDFAEKYNITTIPRYLLIDKNGYIANAEVSYIKNLQRNTFNPLLIEQIETLISE